HGGLLRGAVPFSVVVARRGRPHGGLLRGAVPSCVVVARRGSPAWRAPTGARVRVSVACLVTFRGRDSPAYRSGRELEIEPLLGDVDLDRVAGLEAALEDFLCQRVLDLLLDRPPQRTRTVHRVAARLRQPVARGAGKLELHVALREP